MVAHNKNAATMKDRRKSATVSASPGKQSMVITLKATPSKLRAIVQPLSVEEETAVKESPATSTTLPATTTSNAAAASVSSPNTPARGTPAPQPVSMGPPTEGPKKKCVKRSAAALNGNGEPKIRGKPGPKKKQKSDEGGVDNSRGVGSVPAHKLGPKANQGAINAGLRALDRSGKPCRKWQKGGFVLKSFTGVVWEIPRWTAPPRALPDTSSDESTSASASGSNKENKDSASQVKSEMSNSGADVETQSAALSDVHANSPTPMTVTAA